MFESSPDWIGSLNPAQRDAVLHRGSPLLVVAGAGTGKTFTLACRVASLLRDGVRPERILLLTFTRRAAREMLGRAARSSGADATGRVWGGTFHAVANRLLRPFGRPIGIRPDFTVMDRADQADLMNLIRGEMRLGAGRRRFPTKDTLVSIYSRTVDAGENLRAVLEKHFPWCTDDVETIGSVFDRYVKRKRRQNLLDFEDLLLYLKESRGFDFSGYKRASLVRRVRKRMDTLKIDGFAAYQDFLQVNQDEFAYLFDVILINVTAFFRDPPIWEYVADSVIPALLAAKPDDEPIRVWSAGAASGEEAYTVAMLLAEALGREPFVRRVKVYATDVDDDALQRGRAAAYSAKDVEPIPPALLDRYFDEVNSSYVFDKELRRSVIFGRHDLVQDAPRPRPRWWPGCTSP